MVELTAYKVPTVCIEHVYVWDNTSVVDDEIMSQRLGLIPLNVDPDLILMKESMYKISSFSLFASQSINSFHRPSYRPQHHRL